MENKIQLFEDKRIRTEWDEEREEWMFSIVDVVGVLTEQPTQRGASNYWRKLKQRMNEEGNQLVTNCHQLKLKATTTEISKETRPDSFDENKSVARAGGEVAGNARKDIEARTNKPVITSRNANDFRDLISNLIESKDVIEEE